MILIFFFLFGICQSECSKKNVERRKFFLLKMIEKYRKRLLKLKEKFSTIRKTRENHNMNA